MTNKQPPRLVQSVLTNKVYITTKYRKGEHIDLLPDVTYDVTEDFKRLLADAVDEECYVIREPHNIVNNKGEPVFFIQTPAGIIFDVHGDSSVELLEECDKFLETLRASGKLERLSND